MATKHDLADWLYDALQALEGRARIASLCEHVWPKHDLAANDLFRNVPITDYLMIESDALLEQSQRRAK